MFVITMTKKKITRLLIISLAVIVGVCILIYAILSSVNANASEKKLPIYSVDRNDNKISLTFDVAWENSNTQALLDILEAENVKATFFVTGDWCDRYPEDVMKFFQAGHEIQNHSNNHPHVEGINVNDLIEDTREASKKIEMITNTKPTLYRSPYGEYDDTVLTTIDGMGMKTIQWDVDSVDWKKVSDKEIVKKVTKNTKSGSILLFHNDLENTTKALPEVIKTLKADGFEFVLVSELIYEKDYIIDHTGKQIYQDPALLTFIDSARAEQVLNSENADEIQEIVLKYITAEEFSALKDGITPDLINELLSKMSDEDRTRILALIGESTGEETGESTGDENKDGDSNIGDDTQTAQTTPPLMKDEPAPETTPPAETDVPQTTTAPIIKGEPLPIDTSQTTTETESTTEIPSETTAPPTQTEPPVTVEP